MVRTMAVGAITAGALGAIGLPVGAEPGGPTIVDARVLTDAGLQDRFGSGDVVRLSFDEDMADGLETSAVFVLTDADGDTFNLSCAPGGTAACVLSDAGADVDRLLTLTVNATIADTNGPGDGLLEIPATITSTTAVADQSGTTLDLPASTDVIVDKEPPAATGPDISVAVADSPEPVSAGAEITYTITATNNGPGTPVTMQIQDTLPSGVTFVSASGGTPVTPDPAVGASAGTVHHSFPGVGPAGTVVMTMVVQVNPGTPDATVISNKATATGSSELGADPDPVDNSDTEQTTVGEVASSFSINDVTVNEAAGTATFTVSRSSGVGAASVDVATFAGSAKKPADFFRALATLSFAGGQTSKLYVVNIVEDALDEFQESYTVKLSNPVGGTLADATGVGRINDNDPLPAVSVLNAVKAEGDSGTHNMSFKLQLSAASGKPVTVTFKTSNGSAVAPSDYTAKTVKVTFAAGQTIKSVTVVIKGDTVVEPNQVFNVTLSSPVNATIGDGSGTGQIKNDD